MFPIDCLIGDFPDCLDYFAEQTLLDSRYNRYLATVELRKRFVSAVDAIQSDEFLESLHDTMSKFFGFERWKNLLACGPLKAEFRNHAQLIGSFDGKRLSAEMS